MATTFADILNAAEGTVTTCIDGATPAGHFEVTARVLGHTRSYLLEGFKGDPDSVVKGHVVILAKGNKLEATGYAKGSLVGGYYLGRVSSYEEMFAKMIDHS